MEVVENRGRAGTKGRGSAAHHRDLTQGSIIGNLWTLTWPMTISTVIMMLGPIIDMVWVGSLGTAAIAGVGVAGMAVMVINSARMGLNTGAVAVLARAIGAGDEEEAIHAAQQAFVVSAIFSTIMALIGIFLSSPILVFLGVEPEVVTEGTAYMRILFVGSVAMSFGMMAHGVMQASGDAKTPMKVGIGVRIFHIILSPFLIFGWWIFPFMGVSGAALTNVISQAIGGAIMLWILFTGRTRLRLTMKGFRFDGHTIWRIVRIGIPSSITGMERSLANFVLMILIVPFGTIAVAAHSLVERIDMFINMPGWGLGQASGVLAGQNLGALQPDRAEKTAWTGAGLLTCFTIIASIIVWFGAEPIVRIFNSEPDLVAMSADFLRINIVSYLVFGLVVVLTSCLNGVGDTMVPMLVTLITMWLVQVPMAYILPKVTDLGVYGVRWGIVTAVVMRSIIYTLYFKHGRWRHKEV